MKKNVIAVSSALVAVALVVGTAPQLATTPTSEAPLSSTAVATEPPVDNTPDVSGTIRWVSASQWVVLDDAGHVPNGIESVTVTSSYVRVDYDFTATTVSSVQVTPDEGFASSNVRVGASVGLDYMLIYFYMPSSGSTPVNPTLLSKAGANVWITGWFD